MKTIKFQDLCQVDNDESEADLEFVSALSVSALQLVTCFNVSRNFESTFWGVLNLFFYRGFVRVISAA
jgi:hypothetical protein